MFPGVEVVLCYCSALVAALGISDIAIKEKQIAVCINF